MSNHVAKCAAIPLASVDAHLLAVHVSMHRPDQSILRIKEGEQKEDLLMVTANHDPPVAPLSSALSHGCQKAHGAYVMNHHGHGVLLKPAGSTQVVTHGGGAPVQMPSTLARADLCDVNLMRAYRAGVSRMQDMSFRTSPTTPGNLLLVWVDESAQSRREEADYAMIIERQIEMIQQEPRGEHWGVIFTCVLDTPIDDEGPMMRMMKHNRVRVYKSHQALIDTLFGIEISTHDAKSSMSVHFRTGDATSHSAFHRGETTESYLATVPSESEGISVAAASNPMCTDNPQPRGSMSGFRVSADMHDASSKTGTVVLVSDHSALRRSEAEVVFGSDRRMGDSKSLWISTGICTLPMAIDRVIGTLLGIRRDGDVVAGFSCLASAAAEWETARGDLPKVHSLYQSAVQCVVDGLFQRTREWLQSPVLRVLRCPSTVGLYGCAPPPRTGGVLPHHPTPRGRQQSLALMMQ